MESYQRAREAAQREEWELVWCIFCADASLSEDTDRMQHMTMRRRMAGLCLILGNLAMQAGCADEAFDWYTRCLQFLNQRRMDDPIQRIHALCGRGNCLLMQGVPLCALEEFRGAEKIAKTILHANRTIPVGLAQAHLAMDHMDMALAYGLDALALDGDAVQTYELHLFIGYIHAQMGNQDAAMTVWQSAIESAIRMQRPGDAVKGLILLAGQTHRLEAQRLCGKALRLAGETPPSALLLLCARVAHNNKDAAEWYRKILASHSSNSADRVSAHVALARLAEEAGDIRQALDHWKYACKEDASEARND